MRWGHTHGGLWESLNTSTLFENSSNSPNLTNCEKLTKKHNLFSVSSHSAPISFYLLSLPHSQKYAIRRERKIEETKLNPPHPPHTKFPPKFQNFHKIFTGTGSRLCALFWKRRACVGCIGVSLPLYPYSCRSLRCGGGATDCTKKYVLPKFVKFFEQCWKKWKLTYSSNKQVRIKSHFYSLYSG